MSKAEWDKSFDLRLGSMTYTEAIALYGPPTGINYVDKDLVVTWVFGPDRIVLPSQASPATVLDANANAFRLILTFDADTRLLKAHSCLGRGCPGSK